MQKKFEDIKKKFIVKEEDYSKDQLLDYMALLLNFVRVSEEGQVIVIKPVPTRKILKLILTSRFIAHRVDKSIDEIIGREELESYSYLKKNVFIARFGELFKEGFAEKKGDKIKVKNMLLVQRFLEMLKGENKK